MISGLGRQLAQIAEQGLVSGEPPAAEEAPRRGGAEPRRRPAEEARSRARSRAEAADEERQAARPARRGSQKTKARRTASRRPMKAGTD